MSENNEKYKYNLFGHNKAIVYNTTALVLYIYICILCMAN